MNEIITEDELTDMFGEGGKEEVKEAFKEKEVASWKGSPHTAAMVASQIRERWGDEEVKKYDPKTNCFTYNTWKAKGFVVKKGEKALKSATFVDISKDDEREELRPRNVSLFYYLQVEPIKTV